MKINFSKENTKTIIALVFVLSGAAGLIYQLVWFKYLGLYLGNSTYAQMTVLATFLGGLALGNNYFGKRVEQYNNSIRIYSLLEIFIGLYCLAYPSMNTYLGNAFLSFSSTNEINPQSYFFILIRFGISALLLILPTIAMGGTLPLLSRFFVEKIKDSRRETAILYYLNSSGAVFGVFFGGFFLIRDFGLNATIYSAAFINIIAGLVVLALSKKTYFNIIPFPSAETEQEETQVENGLSKSTVSTVIIIAGLSGVAALLYEMLWTRLLINFIGSSTYAFSIMLMSFISGITIGGWVVSQKFLSRFDKVKLISLLQFMIGGFTIASLFFYERLPYYLWKISYLFSKTEQSFPLFLSSEFIICFLLILFPTIFMGMTLPLAVEIVTSHNKKIGRSVGSVFSVNTFGNVLGVLSAGLILIPFFGLRGSFTIGIGINVLAGLLIIFQYNRFKTSIKPVYGLIIIITFSIYAFEFQSFDKSIMTSGVFRLINLKPPENFNSFLNQIDDKKIYFYKEGVSSTVAVTGTFEDPNYKSLKINGKPDGSTTFDMPTQVLLGQIPLMLCPGAGNVFIVGFGTGTTVGSVLSHDVKKVICAEISTGVIEAAKYFEKENMFCLKDPRLKVYNEDAITLLQISKDKFDVIISEPSNPWIAGIGNLFSKEYFERCYNKLNENGVMAQWFHLYEANDDVVKLVINTFSSVFENAQVWSATSNDIVLVGSKKKIKMNYDVLNKLFNSKKVKSDFARIKIYSPFEFLCTQFASSKNFFIMSAPNPVNSEIRPVLEFLAPKSFFVSEFSTYTHTFDERFDTLSNSLFVKDYARVFPPTKNEVFSAADFAENISRNSHLSFGLSNYLLEFYPNDYNINRLNSKSYKRLGINNPETTSLEKLNTLYPDSSNIEKELNNTRLLIKLNSSTFLKVFSLKKEVDAFLKTAKKDTISQSKIFIQLALAFYKNGEFENAKLFCDKVDSLANYSKDLLQKIRVDDYYYISAMSAIASNDEQKIIKNYLALINYNPNYEDLFRLRRSVTWYLKNGNVILK